MRVPFAFRRPWLLLRGARTDRNRPDLDGLAAINDPVEFVWAILPHAARTFATSILMLPAPRARTAAVGYLYCRMLDTYEDLVDPTDREAALAAFADRMTTLEPPPPAPDSSGDEPSRVDRLLIERCHMVDEVFVALSDSDQQRVAELVRTMSDGMIWSSQRFDEQGGVLTDAEQLVRYCHNVIGEPVLFTMGLVVDSDLSDEHRRDALAVGEMIQLANITRDVERDLARGVGYHPSLLTHLGSTDAAGPVREARRHLMVHALANAPAYARLVDHFAVKRFSLVRASAVLMLLHTDRHYRWCAGRIGHPAWRGPNRTGTIVLAAALAVLSRRWARRVMQRVESDFLAAAAAI